MKGKNFWIASAGVCLALAWACDRDAYSLSVSPETVTITDAQSHPLLTAAVLDADGEEIVISDVEWTSENPDVAAVDNTGRLTAIANGTAVITVKNKTDEKEVLVTVRLSE